MRREFCLVKCAILTMEKMEKKNNGRNGTTKSGKNKNTCRERENYKNLEILEAHTIERGEMKEMK